MRNVAMLTMKTANSYSDIMRMPYVSFLALCYHVGEIQGEIYGFSDSKNNISQKHKTEPDWNKIRQMGGVITG